MNSEKKLEKIKAIICDSGPSSTHHAWFQEIKFTQAGESLIGKMFADGKTLDCIPNCTVSIRIANNTIKISVYHEDIEIGGFKEIDSRFDTIYDFFGVPVQLKLRST